MDWEAIFSENQYLFLNAALWYAGRTTYQSDEGAVVTHREAVEHLFSEALDVDVSVRDDAGVWNARRVLDDTQGK